MAEDWERGRDMSDSMGEIDRHLQEALVLAREQVAVREAAFEREIAGLRQRVKAIEAALVPPENPGGQGRLPLFTNGSVSGPTRMHPAWNGQSTLRSSLPPTEWWVRKLRGLSQSEAMLRIAEERDGVLRITEAKEILLGAKMIKGNPKHAYGHLVTLVKNSDLYDKVAPGTWRLRSTGSTDEPVDGDLGVYAVDDERPDDDDAPNPPGLSHDTSD